MSATRPGATARDAVESDRDEHPRSSTIVWVHGDCLDPKGPALAAHPGAPAIWIWDDALLDEWGVTMKRLVFLYECLLELPVTIRRGDVAAELLAFAREHGATRIATADSPSPRFAAIRDEVAASVPVEVLPVTPFLAYHGQLDLARFGRYWRVAQRHAFGQPPLFDADDFER